MVEIGHHALAHGHDHRSRHRGAAGGYVDELAVVLLLAFAHEAPEQGHGNSLVAAPVGHNARQDALRAAGECHVLGKHLEVRVAVRSREPCIDICREHGPG
jgi:hypothetical protein